jgi:hypothetical protein
MPEQITPGNQDHDITPRSGTIHRAITGDPTNGLSPLEYPLVAICLECGCPIRLERFLFSNWQHSSTKPIDLPSGRPLPRFLML